MRFAPTDVCRDCAEPIMLVDGQWCDETITDPIATPHFASLCEAAMRHMPEER